MFQNLQQHYLDSQKSRQVFYILLLADFYQAQICAVNILLGKIVHYGNFTTKEHH